MVATSALSQQLRSCKSQLQTREITFHTRLRKGQQNGIQIGGEANEGVRVGKIVNVGRELCDFLPPKGSPYLGDGDWVWYSQRTFFIVCGKRKRCLGRARPHTEVNLQALQSLIGIVLENLEKTAFARSDKLNVSCLCLQSMFATSALSLRNLPKPHEQLLVPAENEGIHIRHKTEKNRVQFTEFRRKSFQRLRSAPGETGLAGGRGRVAPHGGRNVCAAVVFGQNSHNAK